MKAPPLNFEFAKFVKHMQLGELTTGNLESARSFIKPDPKFFDRRIEPIEVWTDPPAPVRMLLYNPPSSATHRPAILHFHGGGFVMGDVDMSRINIPAIALEHDAVVVSVDYRLAPEHPFPAALEDAQNALAWLQQTAPTANVDPKKIVLMGESAGGGLAAGLSFMLRDTKKRAAAAQFLVYPMLDSRTGTNTTEKESRTHTNLVWTHQNNCFGWNSYQGEYTPDDRRSAWFSPALARNYSSLPPTFLAVGTLDLFMEENMAFVTSLHRANVSTELHLLPEAVHGFDNVRSSQLAKEFHRLLSFALRRTFTARDLA